MPNSLKLVPANNSDFKVLGRECSGEWNTCFSGCADHEVTHLSFVDHFLQLLKTCYVGHASQPNLNCEQLCLVACVSMSGEELQVLVSFLPAASWKRASKHTVSSTRQTDWFVSFHQTTSDLGSAGTMWEGKL